MLENRTVLFVDDDEAILRSLERDLVDEPYNKLFTSSCKEALEILKQQEAHVIITDLRMPEMSGLEFIRIIKKEYPHIIRMVLSGYNQDPDLQMAIDEGEIYILIPKPWKSGGNFEKLIRQAIEHYNIQNESKTIPQHIPLD